MNTFVKYICALFCVALLVTGVSFAKGPKVSELGNKHNLSSLAWSGGVITNNTVAYRANPDDISGKQICIFCHTPHSAQPKSTLWNRNYATSFTRYSSATLQIRGIAEANYADSGPSQVKLDGPSKLCLGCHDGSFDLGDVLRGGKITMVADQSIQSGPTRFDAQKLRTGHHPVSFTYNDTVAGKIGTSKPSPYGGVYKAPTSAYVKIDKRSGKMECTTCHNPHQNQSDDTECYGGSCDSTNTRKIAPFWVYGGTASDAVSDHDYVCKSCHEFTTRPWPVP